MPRHFKISKFVTMTTLAFKRIKAALVAQRSAIAHSPKAASRLINELGIRDILVEGAANKNKKTSPRKIAVDTKRPYGKPAAIKATHKNVAANQENS